MTKHHGYQGRDPNLLGLATVACLTGESVPEAPDTRNPAAVALGRLGGLKGGPARAKAINEAKRKRIARAGGKAKAKLHARNRA